MEGAVKDFSLAQGGTLYLENSTLAGAFSGSMQGGGLLVMPSGAQMDIPGTVSGNTQLQLIPGTADGEGYVEHIKLGTYVTADESSTGTFTLANHIAATIARRAGAPGLAAWNLEKAVGSLTVTRTVTGTAGGQAQKFTFTVTVAGLPDGTYGDMTFQNGTASFTLRHGESKTASGLPSGAAYEVTIAGAQGYQVSAVGTQGQIPKSGAATAAFTCRKDAAPSQPQPSNPGQKQNPKTGV